MAAGLEDVVLVDAHCFVGGLMVVWVCLGGI